MAREKAIWIVSVKGEEHPRAVKAFTSGSARKFVAKKVADEIVGEARKARPEEGWKLAEAGVQIEEAVDDAS